MLERQAERRGQALLIETATGIVVALLIAVTWMFTLAFTHADEREAEHWLAGSLANQSSSVQWQMRQSIERGRALLDEAASDWTHESAAFSVGEWSLSHGSDLDPNLEMMQIDITGRVRTATDPELIGRSFARDSRFVDFARSMHPFGKDGAIGLGASPGEILLSRPLRWPDGTDAGTLLIDFDPWRGMNDLPNWQLGQHGVIALLRKNGGARILLPTSEISEPDRDQVLSIFDSAAGSEEGAWSGTLLRDRVDRDVYFTRLYDLDLVLLIGVGREEALAQTLNRSEAVKIFAAVVSTLLALGALLVIRQVDFVRKREERLSEDRNLIEIAYGELAMAKSNSERKSAEIEATLAGMTDGVMMLDSDLRLVNWNDRFPERIGIPRGMLRVGLNIEEVLRYQANNGEFGQVDIEFEVLRRMAAMRSIRSNITAERLRPDGATIELRRSRMPDGGLVTLYIDISARKQAEGAMREAQRIAEEATDQKSRFVAIVSHEIRTPLNAVINCLGLLDESELSIAQRRLANTAREAGEALMELVNDILELSNAEAGKVELRPTVFEPTALMEGVRAMFQPGATKRGIRIVLDIAPELPRHIRSDSGRLRQILMNLVSNAAKFSSPGAVTIRAEMQLAGGKKPMLQVLVQDQGPVIPAEEASKLFVPFSRLSNARSSGSPGTGLGLAICERLTRAMGGELGLRVAPSGGNEFWFILPLEAATAPTRHAMPVANTISLMQRPRARILIVEDIPANHLVAATLLRREGFRVDVAESGPAGIAMVQGMPYDLVFMDLIMPEMDGLEATRRIRALPGLASRLPIVALTATTSSDDRTRCIAAGMDDMLGKPIRPAALFELVNSYVGSPTRMARFAEAPVALAANDSPDVIDDARLGELRQGLPPALVMSLVDQCLDDIRLRLPALRTALAGGEHKPIEMAAHALGGMAASYGLAAFDSRMRRIIRHARAGEIDAARNAGEGAEGDFAVAAETIKLHLRDAVA
ncbi:MAG: PAS-domain containing protein [Acetobacteraceae bacterium]|nr:PAS-domain containing protein [Acetobacteraceae bacterium]